MLFRSTAASENAINTSRMIILGVRNVSWEWVSSIVFVMESWLSFVRGGILFIPTAASENAINSSWMIILGVRNDGLGVPFSTCSIWDIGFSTTGTGLGDVLSL